MSAHSIRERLKNRADELGLEFQQALQYYAIERFLYRLSTTPWSDQMIVKGATLLRVWDGAIARPTRDIDFLSRLENTEQTIVQVVKDCITADVPDDGLRLDFKLTEELIATEGRYPGVRVKVSGDLDGARFVIKIDVGIGDATEPNPGWVKYPVLLDSPIPTILSYSPETAIAEKFEVIVTLGLVNSRLKDYYDMWMLAEAETISPEHLIDAVSATFGRRETIIPDRPPVGLTDEFCNQESTKRMWNSFHARLAQSGVRAPEKLQDVVNSINRLMQPVYDYWLDLSE